MRLPRKRASGANTQKEKCIWPGWRGECQDASLSESRWKHVSAYPPMRRQRRSIVLTPNPRISAYNTRFGTLPLAM